MNVQTLWERVYGEKPRNAVSWYTPHLARLLGIIERASPCCARISENDRPLATVRTARYLSHSMLIAGTGTEVDHAVSLGRSLNRIRHVGHTAVDAIKPI